jgi:cell division protein FtsN
MARNEEGEFELVLGNRQLLSIFFLVVVLLGVFFTMGYIVGRNTGPVTSEIVADSVGSSKPPVVIDPPSSSSSSSIPVPKPAYSKPSDDSMTAPQVQQKWERVDGKPEASAEPQPIKTIEKAAEKVTEKVAEKAAEKKIEKKEPEKRPEPVKAEKKPEPEKKPERVAEPAKGNLYLQAVAVARADADKVASTLKAKGIPASVAPGPDGTIFRVVVGPLSNDSVGDMRAKLESAGYRPIIKRF